MLEQGVKLFMRGPEEIVFFQQIPGLFCYAVVGEKPYAQYFQGLLLFFFYKLRLPDQPFHHIRADLVAAPPFAFRDPDLGGGAAVNIDLKIGMRVILSAL